MSYGTMVLRRAGGELRGAYRFGDGIVRGDVDADGIFRGVWCEGSRRPRSDDAGLVEWRLVRTRSGERIVTGTWRFGFGRRRDGTLRARRRLGPAQAQARQGAGSRAARCGAIRPRTYCHAPGQ